MSDTPTLLPLPKPVLEHHGGTINRLIEDWRAQGQVTTPVLLLTGIVGIGKRSLAHHLAQAILCEKSGLRGDSGGEPGKAEADPAGDLFGGALAPAAPEAGDSQGPVPCGECAHCLRAIKGTWVDFTEILPEEEDGPLKIQQFRELKANSGFSGGFSGSFGDKSSGYRIISIPNAERMTPQAANSVLKLLEEPPRGWVFLLTASDPTLLLPTIISRCQRLRLKPFPADSIMELLALSDIPAQRRAICAELAQGSWAKAQALGSDEIWETRAVLFRFLKSPESALNELVEWASKEGTHFDLLVDQLEQLTADLLRWSASGSPGARSGSDYRWSNADGKDALASHAILVSKARGGPGPARAFWLERAERLARARRESLAPLNRKVLVQDLLLPWADFGSLR